MIARSDLGALDLIKAGGFGAVYRVPGFSLPGSPIALAYKEVLPSLSPDKRRIVLDAMVQSVAFREALSPADRADLDEYTTWPLAVVEDGNGPCGIVMPLLPDDFFLTTRTPAGKRGSLVFSLAWMSAADHLVQKKGMDRSAVQDPVIRVALLAKLVYAVGRLHRHGAVYGDISLENAAVATSPPRLRLLDCDAAAPLHDPARVQGHSLAFTPPEIEADPTFLQDECTDVWKLGICIVRGMQHGDGIVQAVDPSPLRGVLDDATVAVVTRAVGSDRAARPTVRELFEALERALFALVAPPVLQGATLNRTTLPRGLQVEVAWQSSGGSDVRITGANGLLVTLPGAGTGTARHVVTPRGSGEIVVEVVNRHGTARRVAGVVTLYDLPSFSVTIGDLPRVRVPVAPSVPPVAPVRLPAVPGLSVGSLPAPRVTLPPPVPILRSTAPLRASPPPEPAGADVRNAIVAASGRLRRAMTEASDEVRDDIRRLARDRAGETLERDREATQ